MKYKKPNYLPENDVIATKHGWVQISTGEILESIPNLDKLIEQSKPFEQHLFDLQKSYINTNKDEVVVDEVKDSVDYLGDVNLTPEIEEPKEVDVVKPTPKKRGRPKKIK